MIICKQYLILLTAFLFIFTSNALKANESNKNPYLITDIFASAEKETAYSSRLEATKRVNRVAFGLMLKNLGIPPILAEEIEDEDIDEAVYSRQIADEKIAGNIYSAKFNISFLKSSVDSILDKNKSIFEARLNKDIVLLFAVEIGKKKSSLWEENNKWRDSLKDNINIINNRNIIIPEGSFDEIALININNIENSDYKDFSILLAKYIADSAIIVYFKFDPIENKANITLTIIKEGIEVKKTRLVFINSKNLSEESLMIEAAQRTLKHIDGIEKKPKGFIPGSASKIELNIKISSLKEWLEIKKKLSELTFIKELNIHSISRNLAKVKITHESELESLTKLLLEENLLLEKDNNKYFLSKK